MVCEPHRYLMGRIAGYGSASLPSVNYDISSQYSTRAQKQYQGNDTMQPQRNSGTSYAPTGQAVYQFMPQKQYDFGAVRSPAIGAIHPIRRPHRHESNSASIDDLPIIEEAGTAQKTMSTEYQRNPFGNDYSMRAASANQASFETQKQDLARTIMAELAVIQSKKTTLMHVN